MKSILGVLLIISLSASLIAEDETEEQIKQAQEAAKQMGVKMPDMQKLMEESAKEDEADEAANKAAATPAPSAAASVAPRVNVDIPAGTAKGSMTFEGVTAELKFASAFVDQKDDRKPTVLIVSDQKLPAEKWTSEFDMMRDKTKWSGIAVFLDKDGEVYRTDVHSKGQQSSVSGMFDVNINDPKSADIAGAAKTSSDSSDRKLDVTFHATRK